MQGQHPSSSPAGREAIVVGGSAAGLYTAVLVARGGRRVRILEAAPELNPESRTLIVTRHLRDLLPEAAAASAVNEIRRFELFTDGRSAQVALAQPDLIIERARLIRALAAEAAQSGAVMDCDTRFLAVAPNARGLRLEVESGGKREELHAADVVGADGAASRVARSAGWPPLDTVPLLQAIVRLPKDCPADTVRVWFVPDDTPYFYWLIPESPERAAFGLIAEDGRDAARCLTRFLEKKGIEPLEWQGARIPAYRGWVPVRRRLGLGHVYLVGDAAAQVKVTTIGGVVTGFRGARGVAEAILSNGRSAKLHSLRRELGTHWLIRRALHHFEQEDYSRLVDLLNTSARSSLGEVTRDEAARLLWQMIRRQPRLALLGLRGLLLGRNGVRRE
jgi:flavin-dependent dehydrogenase